MKIKLSYIAVSLSVVAVAVLGSAFSSAGMPWYHNAIVRPDLTPPDWVFPVAWNLIYILGVFSAILSWERTTGLTQKTIAGLFIANGALNAGWSLLFFVIQDVGLALIEMIVLEITTLALITMLWKRVRAASVMLLPYAAWVGFATYLTWEILKLNY